jgi:hypothetical protein
MAQERVSNPVATGPSIGPVATENPSVAEWPTSPCRPTSARCAAAAVGSTRHVSVDTARYGDCHDDAFLHGDMNFQRDGACSNQPHKRPRLQVLQVPLHACVATGIPGSPPHAASPLPATPRHRDPSQPQATPPCEAPPGHAGAATTDTETPAIRATTLWHRRCPAEATALSKAADAADHSCTHVPRRARSAMRRRAPARPGRPDGSASNSALAALSTPVHLWHQGAADKANCQPALLDSCARQLRVATGVAGVTWARADPPGEGRCQEAETRRRGNRSTGGCCGSAAVAEHLQQARGDRGVQPGPPGAALAGPSRDPHDCAGDVPSRQELCGDRDPAAPGSPWQRTGHKAAAAAIATTSATTTGSTGSEAPPDVQWRPNISGVYRHKCATSRGTTMLLHVPRVHPNSF